MASNARSNNKVALVTGANRGIGYAVVKVFCQSFDGTIILTARNHEKGLKAVQKLKEEGLHPQFLQMDVSSIESIIAAKREVEKKYGRLDILVNNAGVYPLEEFGYSLPERAELAISVDYYGVLNTTNVFLPLLSPQGRVISIGSDGASLKSTFSPHLQEQLTSPNLTIRQLSMLIDQYLKAAKTNDKKTLQAWPPTSSYADSCTVAGVGKVILTELFASETKSDVDFICVSPGWVRTDMGGPDGPTDPIDVGKMLLKLVNLPPGKSRYNGKFLDLLDLQYLTWEITLPRYEKYSKMFQGTIVPSHL